MYHENWELKKQIAALQLCQAVNMLGLFPILYLVLKNDWPNKKEWKTIRKAEFSLIKHLWINIRILYFYSEMGMILCKIIIFAGFVLVGGIDQFIKTLSLQSHGKSLFQKQLLCRYTYINYRASFYAHWPLFEISWFLLIFISLMLPPKSLFMC